MMLQSGNMLLCTGKYAKCASQFSNMTDLHWVMLWEGAVEKSVVSKNLAVICEAPRKPGRTSLKHFEDFRERD
jgi:hypothetical protein